MNINDLATQVIERDFFLNKVYSDIVFETQVKVINVFFHYVLATPIIDIIQEELGEPKG